MPVVSNDRCLGFPSRKLWRLRSFTSRIWWSMSLLTQFIDVCGRPCDHAETFFVVQFLDKVVDMPVMSNDRCPGFQCRKPWKFRSCNSMAQFVDGCGRPCDHAATFVSSTVEVPQIQFTARVRGHSCCTTVAGAQLPAEVDMAAVKVFSAVSPLFSRSSGLSRS